MIPSLITGSGRFLYPYKLDYSCRFNVSDSASLSMTPGTTGNRKLWTFSTWYKPARVESDNNWLMGAYDDANNRTDIYIGTDSKIRYYATNAGVNIGYYNIDLVTKDQSSWYHIVAVLDAANTSLDFYINNVLATKTLLGNTIANTDTMVSYTGAVQYVGSFHDTANYLGGYLAETILVAGQALTPASFGREQNGIWIPKKYSGTYGDQGFRLDYADSADLGNDVSGSGNDFASSGLTAADQVPDSPTENYCTLNPLSVAGNGTFTNGNLDITGTGATWATALGTIALPDSGKWYWEYKSTAQGTIQTGIMPAEDYLISGAPSSSGLFSGAYHAAGGTNQIIKYVEGVSGGNIGTTAWTGDYYQFAVDMDAGKLWFGENDTWYASGDPVAGTNEFAAFTPGINMIYICAYYTTTGQAQHDFGQLGFTYTPPTGYQALNWTNVTTAMELDEPKHLEGNQGFDTIAYEGTGAEQARTDLEFSPDLIWIKNRDAADENVITDSVRGATEELNSDSTNVESTVAQGVKSIDVAGFTLGTDDRYNTNAESFVAWNWLESVDYGFDIASIVGTGATLNVNHSLGVVPEMILCKGRETVGAWTVYHKDMNGGAAPEDFGMYLDTTGAEVDSAGFWNDTAPTSSVFTLGAGNPANISAEGGIAYLFASVEGYSKVFSYTGNANADGPFVYCGFKPKFVLIKNASAAATSWIIHDTERDTYNVSTKKLFPNATTIETDSAGNNIDILSNGLKCRTTDGATNGSGNTLLGIAFAETPFPWANAR